MTTRIQQVIDSLQAISIPAVRGFAASLQPELARPAAAVSVHRATETESVLAVTVYCPPQLGGSVCENTALSAAQALRTLGAQCTQEACGYDSSSGFFSIRLLASWEQTALPYQVSVGGSVLSHLTGLHTEKKATLHPVGEVGAGMIGMRWEEKCWDITVEELLPGAESIVDVGIETFQLEIIRAGGKEQFPTCRWVSVRREDTPQGIKQVRIARTWEDRRIVNG